MDWLGLLKMAQDQGNKNGFTPANLSGFGSMGALMVYMLIGMHDMSQQVTVMSERVAGATARIQQLEKSSNIGRVAIEKLTETVADIQREDIPKLSEKSDYQRDLINKGHKAIDGLKVSVADIQNEIGKMTKEAILRKRSFVSKQSGKIEDDPTDVKGQDIIDAVQYCREYPMEMPSDSCVRVMGYRG